MPKEKKQQKNNILKEALKNPFIKAIRKELEDKGESFTEFLCWKGQQDSGIACTNKDHIQKKFKFKTKLECERQVSALISLHLQSKHVPKDRLDKILEELKN